MGQYCVPRVSNTVGCTNVRYYGDKTCTCNIEYRSIHKNGLVLGGYRNVLGSFYLDNVYLATRFSSSNRFVYRLVLVRCQLLPLLLYLKVANKFSLILFEIRKKLISVKS